MSIDPIILYIGYALSILIAIFVTRAIFSIPTFLKIQKAKLQVLTEIAIQQGVNAEVLRTIHVHNELTAREKTNEERREELRKQKDQQTPK